MTRLGCFKPEVVPTYRCPKFWVSDKSMVAVFGTKDFSELGKQLPKAIEIRKDSFFRQEGCTFGYPSEKDLFEDYFKWRWVCFSGFGEEA